MKNYLWTTGCHAAHSGRGHLLRTGKGSSMNWLPSHGWVYSYRVWGDLRLSFLYQSFWHTDGVASPQGNSHCHSEDHSCPYTSVQFAQDHSNNRHTGTAIFKLIQVIIHTSAVTAGWLLIKQSSHLKHHEWRRHSKELDRPYLYPHCSKRYAQKWNLDSHCRAYHSPKGPKSHPYKCLKCGSSFTQLSNLCTHERKVVCSRSLPMSSNMRCITEDII